MGTKTRVEPGSSSPTYPTSDQRQPNRYAKGTRFEHKVMDDLVSRGWSVMRAAGSKGETKIDVMAFKEGFPMLMIQAKVNGQISKEEWDRVYDVAEWYSPGWTGGKRAAIPVIAANGIGGRGVTYMILEGHKIPYARSQPWSLMEP